MLKNISWADRTSAFCCCDDDTPEDKVGDKGLALELANILDGGEEQGGARGHFGDLHPTSRQENNGGGGGRGQNWQRRFSGRENEDWSFALF